MRERDRLFDCNVLDAAKARGCPLRPMGGRRPAAAPPPRWRRVRAKPGADRPPAGAGRPS